MRRKFLLVLVSVLAICAMWAAPARADGIIIPEPPICAPERPCPPPCSDLPCPPRPIPMQQLNIKYHHVTVTIQDQVAVTHVDQVFVNPNDWAIEGTYLFPLPQDAAVSSFTLWVDGQPVKGEVLDAAQARQKYEEIVRSLRDPALLEYAGRGAVQASIFPIPPKGERRIELEYSQALAAENGLVRYTYPLNTEKFSAVPLESVSVSVQVQSSQPIRAVYSPSHNISVDRKDEFNVNASYEASQVLPDTDFALYYSLGESEALHLLTYRDPSDRQDPDGFFLLLLAPKPGEASQPVPKDVLLVLDQSGSMEGDKFRQAQDALKYVLNHLNPEDRFNIVSFSTGLQTYARALRPADEAAEALAWVDRLSAQGSTDINRALLEAASMADRSRPTYVIFLTDGLPTIGETQSQKIIDNVAAAAPDNLRLFAFGVGYDVDTFLLDSLAQAHHGATSYITPGQLVDEIISAFYQKISTPVMTNLALDFGDLATYDLYPQPLPDLFQGSQIVVVGRYRAGGSADLTLTGLVNNETQTLRYPGLTFTQASQVQDTVLGSIPRLWATRKIGFLLNQVRLQGPDQETIDQIVRLSIRYGIITPYTSYLVTEPSAIGAEAQQRIAQDAFGGAQSAAAAPTFGQDAVEKAAGESQLNSAQAPAETSQEAAGKIRVVGARTFVFTGGIWTDTAFDPQQMSTVKVTFLSDDYFALARSDPSLASALALGERVIALSGSTAYEVVPSGESTPPLDITPTPAAPSNPVTQPTGTAPTQVPDSTAQPAPSGKSPSPAGCAAGLAPVAIVAAAAAWKMRKRQ